MNDRLNRFSAIIDPDRLGVYCCYILGCGAVGKPVATMLANMGVGKIVLIDGDTVGPENLGTQGWALAHLGRQKVDALAAEIARNNPEQAVERVPEMFGPDSTFPECGHMVPVLFNLPDSLDVRRQVFTKFLAEMPSGTAFDGRCHRQTVWCHTFRTLTRFEELTSTDAEVPNESCTTRQTPYTGYLAAAVLVQMFANMVMDNDFGQTNVRIEGGCLSIAPL